MANGQVSPLVPGAALQLLAGRLAPLLLVAWAICVAGCAHPPAQPADLALYQAEAPPGVAASHTPVFLAQHPAEPFNRIGTAAARAVPGGEPEVFVDPDEPAVYFETREFHTARGRYTNLVYRIHFPEVPLGWGRINLTAGRNPGILVIYTLDDKADLLLVTTVHTCGCYLAFLPTAALPAEAYPPDWPGGSQRIYGYDLPGQIGLPRQESDDRIVFTLASETHRIMAAGLAGAVARDAVADRRQLRLLPMSALYALPYDDRTIPFFETEGCRAGYVRDSSKILERLLISWWALDLYVGEDKAYGSQDDSGAVFYTSLKFWARQDSDMRDFPAFLSYWGWGL